MEIEPFAAEEINFTDYDGKYYEFSPMRELSKTGVIKGNEKGEALPFENIIMVLLRVSQHILFLRIEMYQEKNLLLWQLVRLSLQNSAIPMTIV